MQTPPLPADEARRQNTLLRLAILDSAPEVFTQNVAEAAASIANVPIAAVSLVDSQRQWFKASCGLDMRETSRDISFCAHAILGEQPLVVDDARADPRFADNPMVTGQPYVRFYAGFPLTVNGANIGALCVIDDRPRTLTRAQVHRLADVATATAVWLAQRGHGTPAW